LPRVAAHKVDKSIAVLPFENLSDEKENAYFADGVQDDVLTNLEDKRPQGDFTHIRDAI